MFKSLFKSTTVGLVNKIIAGLGSFFLLPFMLKQLGAYTFGVWMAISSSIYLLGILDLGIGNTLMNFISINAGNKQAISFYIKLAYYIQLVFIAMLLLVFGASFSSINWASIFNISKMSTDILCCIAITVVCFVLSLASSSIYSIQRGLQRSLTANSWQLAGTVIYLFLLWFVLKTKPNLVWVALANFGVPLLISSINTFVFICRENLLQTPFKLEIKRNDVLNYINNSGLMFFLQLAGLICFETDCLILAHYTTYTDVAKFSIIAKIYAIPTIFLGVYLQVLWPAYSKALAGANWQWIKKTLNQSTAFSIIGSAIFIILVFFLKDALFKFWLKNDLTISFPLFLAFSFGLIVNSIDNNIATMLNGLNKIKVQVCLAVLMVITNLTLSVFFVKRWGVPGVTWGTAISTLLFSVIPLWFYIKVLLKKNIGAKATV